MLPASMIPTIEEGASFWGESLNQFVKEAIRIKIEAVNDDRNLRTAARRGKPLASGAPPSESEQWRAELVSVIDFNDRMAGLLSRSAAGKTGITRKRLLSQAREMEEVAADARRAATAENVVEAAQEHFRKFMANRQMEDFWSDHRWQEEWWLKGMPIKTVAEWLKFKDQILRQWLRDLRTRGSVGRNSQPQS